MAHNSDIGFTRYIHSNMRLKARYNIEITYEEYIELCKKIQKGKAEGTVTAYDGHNKEAWIKVKDQWVCAQYKTSEKLICTFLPVPPPNIADEAYKQFSPVDKGQATTAKIMAAASKMVKNGTAPIPKDTAVSREDLIYLREQIKDAVALIMQNHDVKGAVVLLDAISKVPLKMLPYSDPNTQTHIENTKQVNNKLLNYS